MSEDIKIKIARLKKFIEKDDISEPEKAQYRRGIDKLEKQLLALAPTFEKPTVEEVSILDEINSSSNIHSDAEYEKYKKLEGVNFSLLKYYLDTPAHFYQKLLDSQLEEQEEKKQFRFGRALHCMTLTPDFYDMQFGYIDLSLKPNRNRDFRDKENRKWKMDTEAQLASSGKTIITLEEYNTINGMGASLRANKNIHSILKYAKPEKMIQWVDPITGATCKGIVDLDGEERGYVGDLKGLVDGSKRAFQKALAAWKWYMQLPFYSDGLKIIDGIERKSNYFIVIEKTPPYHCALYELEQRSKDLGKRVYMELLAVHIECYRKKEWKGYEIFSDNSAGVIPIDVPEYEFYNIEGHPLFREKKEEIDIANQK